MLWISMKCFKTEQTQKIIQLRQSQRKLMLFTFGQNFGYSIEIMNVQYNMQKMLNGLLKFIMYSCFRLTIHKGYGIKLLANPINDIYDRVERGFKIVRLDLSKFRHNLDKESIYFRKHIYYWHYWIHKKTEK
jgi:hypothetical protein